MTYNGFINGLIREQVRESKHIVLYGQNISAGSCLSGLTRGLDVQTESVVMNTPNAENTLVGVGFGLMLSGVSSVFFMKQLDFLLLGIDHLANTYNYIRLKEPEASFTIMPIIVDLGYQGMQSSHNNLADICSLARVKGLTLTNRYDSERIIQRELVKPGFRIIGVSQRLFGKELISPKELVYANDDNTLFQYHEGADVTIVCFNLSFPYGVDLHERFESRGYRPSLFSVSAVTPIDWEKVVADVSRTGKIVIIDDSKSENLSCYQLLSEVADKCSPTNRIVVKRKFSQQWFCPQHDALEINYDQIIDSTIHSQTTEGAVTQTF